MPEAIPPKVTRVAKGQHVVPSGIAVLEFHDGEQDSISTPPAGVENLLQRNELTYVYKYFVSKFCRKGKTFLTSKGHTRWIESRLVAVVQEFQTDFVKKKVRLALCQLVSGCGSYRWFWLEFRDATVIPATYASPYQISSHKLVLRNQSHVIPPNGSVQVQELTYDITKIPDEVKTMMESKGLFHEYKDMIQAIDESKTTRTWTESWKTTEVLAIVKEHASRIVEQEIELTVCKRLVGTADECKWIEIIDTKAVPKDYVVAYSVDAERLKAYSTSRYNSVRIRGPSVAVQDLMVDGQQAASQQQQQCPSEVVEILERKGLQQAYNQLDQAMKAAKSLRNFLDLWRLTEEKLVTFQSLDDFKASFKAKGIQIILCESVGKSGRNYWLEFVDSETHPDYSSPFDVAFVTEREQQQRMKTNNKPTKKVLNGQHRVPEEGVAVQEIHKTLTEPFCCSPEVQEMLEPKGLVPLYEECIKAVANSSSARKWGNWHSEGIATALQDFAKRFEQGGVKVVVCKLKPESGESVRWFEFIDLKVVAEGYVPQFDASNWDEELETAGGYKLQFPRGVVVQKLMDRKVVAETVPPSVNALMGKKGCLELYLALVDVLVESVLGDRHQFSESNMKELSNTLGPKFEAKGVSVFLSFRPEPAGGKSLFWMEFVDRELQPNYLALHGVEMERLPAKGMSREEMMVAGSNILAEAMEEAVPLLFGF